MDISATMKFPGPVHMQAEPGETVEVASTAEATRCLLKYWRRECMDEAYLLAMKICLKVSAGMAEPEAARAAFAAAALQAGRLLPEPSHGSG